MNICSILQGFLLVAVLFFPSQRVTRADDLQPSGIKLQVKVTDSSVEPVIGAKLRILTLPSMDRLNTESVRLEAKENFTTDAKGEFQSPTTLKKDRAYIVEVDAPGFLHGLSRWTNPRERGTVELPNVVLRRLVSVKGRVTDHCGNGLAEVKVIQSGDGPRRTETVTDKQGRFEIGGIPEGTAFLFAEKKGFRFHGVMVDATREPVEIVLKGRNNPNPRTIKTLPPPRIALRKSERKELALELLQTHIDQLITGGFAEDATRLTKRREFMVTYGLSWIDPLPVFDRLNALEQTFSDLPEARQQMLTAVAGGVADSDFEEAIALVKQIRQPENRAFAYLFWISESEKLHRTEKLRAVFEAISETRKIPDVGARSYYLYSIANALIDLGSLTNAEAMLKEALREMQSLPKSSPTTRRRLGRLAAVWARLDHHAAMKLMRDAEEYEYLNIAKNISKQNPAGAELAVSRVTLKDDPLMQRVALRLMPQICYNAALTDPERAERIAMKILAPILPAAIPSWISDRGTEAKPEQQEEMDKTVNALFLKAQAFGIIAEAIVDRQPKQARTYLKKAIDTVLPIRREAFGTGGDFDYISPANVLSVLIPTVERIDPAEARELFWRSLSLRLPPERGENERRQMQDISRAGLALLLSRYDGKVANTVLTPIKERERARLSHGGMLYPWIMTTQLRMDPNSIISQLRDPAARANMDLNNYYRGVYLNVLAKSLTNDIDWSEEGKNTFHDKSLKSVRKTLKVYVEKE